MQKIVPHLWFDKEAKEATAFYATLFPDSTVTNITTITDTPSGDCDIVNFSLAGQEFMAISAGPYFKFNPSISLFVVFDTEAEITAVWDKLIVGGESTHALRHIPMGTKIWLATRQVRPFVATLNERVPQTRAKNHSAFDVYQRHGG